MKIEDSQLIMQLHHENKISARALCEAIGLDYDEEVKRLRRIQREEEEARRKYGDK